jgi:alpha-ketoglutarate-dependent taurine dioxygenase
MADGLDTTPINLHKAGAVDRISHGLRVHGVAVFAGVKDRAEALGFARSLVTVVPHRDSDRDGITTVAQRDDVAGAAGFAGFSDRELPPHTEGSALVRPPRVLILICARPARVGGHTILVDGGDVYDHIAADDPAMLDALCTPRSVYFGGSCGHLGSLFQKTPGGRVVVRMRLDDLVRFSPTVAPYVGRLRHIIDRRVHPVTLAEGDGFIVLNDRWLHGRTQFTGDRAMLRILGNPLPSLAVQSGFRPQRTVVQPLGIG